MDHQAALADLLVAVLKENFPDEVISELKVESIEMDREAGEIRIVLHVGTEVAPEKFAEGYFGLTSRLQRSVREKAPTLSDFFPIITPEFGQGVHAA